MAHGSMTTPSCLDHTTVRVSPHKSPLSASNGITSQIVPNHEHTTA